MCSMVHPIGLEITKFGNVGDGTEMCAYMGGLREKLIHIDRIEEHIREYKAAQKMEYGVF